jgi:hypothetical protein
MSIANTNQAVDTKTYDDHFDRIFGERPHDVAGTYVLKDGVWGRETKKTEKPGELLHGLRGRDHK